MNKIICPNCGSDNKPEGVSCKECKSNLKLNNKYYLKKIIGENKQITYLATDTEALEAQVGFVVIKEFSLSLLENWKSEDLFKREIAVLKSLNHDQIPNLIDDFEMKDGRGYIYYLVMEYIDGINLEEEVLEKRYSETEVLDLIEELSKILGYLHSFSPPIVHRDIKPSNIIRRKSDNKLVLIDFGAVTDALKPEGGSTVVGTYGYMAPEQFMGKASVQSDYYSLGAIIIKLLTKSKLHEIIDISDLRFIDKINVSDQMKVILMKLLTLDLSKRVKSVKEFLLLIEGYRNNTLDLANSLDEYIDSPNKEKEIKKVRKKQVQTFKKQKMNNKSFRDFKKEYKRLEEVFNKVKNKKKDEAKVKKKDEEEGLLSTLAQDPFSMIILLGIALFLIKKGIFSLSGVFFFVITTIILLLTLSLPYSYLKNHTFSVKNKFMKEIKSFNFDKELVYLFLNKNRSKFSLKASTKNLNKGKLLLYKKFILEMDKKEENILNKKKEKLYE